ncbi:MULTISPECIES: DUF1642 domain-containing protein [Lactococcus]|uniref:DUF1642 domain-containing protein n=1 Tax=Lactococcus TaxID=1357 RepID=UPI0022E0366A|nr:DUF1642 domain-containing protein [Lactococcus petauri]
MKKFEEELFSEVPCKFGLSTEGEYKQSILVKHFGDWVSPEDHQFKVGEVQDDLSCANEEIERLNAKLEKQQPEIPYFVAEGIKSIPYHYTAFGAMLLVKEKIEITKGGDINSDWLPLYNWLFSNNEINSQDLFSQVWINGYTVAKEKRFYLKNKIELEEVGSDLIGYLNLFLTNGGYLTNNINRAKKFTKQEIDSMETGSYELVPVEDGE